MIRCYFTQDRVAGFCHQWPTGLLQSAPRAPSRGPWEDADAPHYERLRMAAESECVPAMIIILELDTNSLPVIWDADFLYGPRTFTGQDTYVLCEINVSSVFAIPEQAPAAIAVRSSPHRRSRSRNRSIAIRSRPAPSAIPAAPRASCGSAAIRNSERR